MYRYRITGIANGNMDLTLSPIINIMKNANMFDEINIERKEYNLDDNQNMKVERVDVRIPVQTIANTQFKVQLKNDRIDFYSYSDSTIDGNVVKDIIEKIHKTELFGRYAFETSCELEEKEKSIIESIISPNDTLGILRVNIVNSSRLTIGGEDFNFITSIKEQEDSLLRVTEVNSIPQNRNNECFVKNIENLVNEVLEVYFD